MVRIVNAPFHSFEITDRSIIEADIFFVFKGRFLKMCQHKLLLDRRDLISPSNFHAENAQKLVL